MRITNDKVEFDTADFDRLSDFAKKALLFYVGGRIDPDTQLPVLRFEDYLALGINEQIDLAKTALAAVTLKQPEVESLVRGIAAADAAQLQAAQPCFDQLATILPSALLPGGEKILPMPEVSIK